MCLTRFLNLWAGEAEVSIMKTNLVFTVHATGLNKHVGTRRTSGQAWSTSEQGHGGGFRKKACEVTYEEEFGRLTFSVIINFDSAPASRPTSLLFSSL